MSGFDPEAVRDALVAQLAETIPNTEVYAHDEYSDQYPAIVVRYTDGEFISYFESFGPNGYGNIRFDLDIYAGALEDSSAGRVLDRYLTAGSAHPSSVVDALLADKTLGGVATTLNVLNARGYRKFKDGVMATIPVDVAAKKVSAQA